MPERPHPELSSMQQLLERIGAVESDGGEGQVSLGAILEEVGRRSFGPLLLLAGLITLAPLIGDIPGVPTLMALLVLLTSAQLLIGRQYFWLPRWLLARSVPRAKLQRALAWLQRPARFIDRLLRPRSSFLVEGTGLYFVALTCIVIALAMPVMELVPFSANGAGAALTAFGAALIARDGLLALFASIATATTLGLVAYQLL